MRQWLTHVLLPPSQAFPSVVIETFDTLLPANVLTCANVRQFVCYLSFSRLCLSRTTHMGITARWHFQRWDWSTFERFYMGMVYFKRTFLQSILIAKRSVEQSPSLIWHRAHISPTTDAFMATGAIRNLVFFGQRLPDSL